MKFVWGVLVNLVLSFVLSLSVGIATTAFNGMPINGATIGLPLLYGTIIGTVVTTVIPVNKLGIKFATWNNAPEGTPLCALYKNFVILAIMVPIMNFFVTGLMIGFFSQEFFNGWLCPIPAVYPVGYVTALLFEPVAVSIACAITRYRPTPPEQADSFAV